MRYSKAGSPRLGTLLGIILLTGLAGAFAIAVYLAVTDDLVLRVATPQVLFQWDASNFLGNAAFAGGWKTAALGMLFHLAVSTIWAGAFVLVAVRIRALVQRPILYGLIFGIVVRLVMWRLVVPLGSAPHSAPELSGLVNVLVAHTLFFGLPVAWIASRGLRVAGESGVQPIG